MKNKELSILIEKLNELKFKYRYYQIAQENAKEHHNFYDPEEYCDNGIDRWEHEMRWQYRIADNKIVLKSLANNIKEFRKKIKTLQRLENGKTS